MFNEQIMKLNEKTLITLLKEFEKHLQAIEYVERIQLYYQTLSILNREKEMLLLAVN